MVGRLPFNHLRARLTLPSRSEEWNEDSLISRELSLFLDLSAAVPVYPTLNESYRDSQKLHVIYDLDAIAHKITKTARPETSDLPGVIKGKPVVLKHTASSYSRHVYISSSRNPRTPLTWSSFHHYFYQEYVPSLKSAGEVRVFVANATTAVSRIATRPIPRTTDVQSWEVRALPRLASWGTSEFVILSVSSIDRLLMSTCLKAFLQCAHGVDA
jgi:hypothetical protein